MSGEQIEGVPMFARYVVGDLEMLPRPDGKWMQACDVYALVDWLTDDDRNAVILAKLKCLEGMLR